MIKNKKDKDVRALLDAKETYYLNEHSVFYAMQCLNDIKMENEGYNIADNLGYLLELLSYKAHPHKVLLVLGREACFPKEVSGDKIKFEMLMMEILVYIIDHCTSEGEIKVFANMKCPDPMGFVLSFVISAAKNDDINPGTFDRIFTAKDGDKVFHQYGLHMSNCRTLLHLLKGNIEVGENEKGGLRLCIEIPFANCDSSKEVPVVHKLGIYETERINEYTVRWLSKRIIVPEPVESSKIIDTSAILRSPAPRPMERLSLRKDPKTTPGSNKSLLSQDLVKKEMIARLKKKPQPTDTPQPESSGSAAPEDSKESEIGSGGNSAVDIRKNILDASPDLSIKPAAVPPLAINKTEIVKKSGFYREPATDSPLVVPQTVETPVKSPPPDQAPSAEPPKLVEEKAAVIVEKSAPSAKVELEEEKKAGERSKDSLNDRDYDVGEDGQDDINRVPSIETPISMKSKSSQNGGRRVDSREMLNSPDKRSQHLHTCTTRIIFFRSKAIAPGGKEERKGKKQLGTNQKPTTQTYQKMVIKLRAKKKWQKISIQGVDKPNGIVGKTPKVLIVEDNQFNVLPIQSTLRRNMIEYHLAKNGLMAVDRYNQAMKESYLFFIFLRGYI